MVLNKSLNLVLYVMVLRKSCQSVARLLDARALKKLFRFIRACARSCCLMELDRKNQNLPITCYVLPLADLLFNFS